MHFAEGQPPYCSHVVGVNFRQSFIDSIDLHIGGLLRIYGWSDLPQDQINPPDVYLDSHAVDPDRVFRVHRPDVASVKGISSFSGIAWEYFLRTGLNKGEQRPVTLEVQIDERSIFSDQVWFRPVDYSFLFATDKVASRNDLYRSAKTPPRLVSQNIVELAVDLPEPILDFGCGLGVLVQALRERGKVIEGVDLDISSIVKNVLPDVREYISFYDGDLPSKYHDGSFASVICSEVLEHIPNYRKTLAELVRIAGRKVMVSVPNIDAIPILAPHYAIPWHMLEIDHVNFFTQASLARELDGFFKSVEFYQIHDKRINNTLYYANIAAICSK